MNVVCILLSLFSFLLISKHENHVTRLKIGYAICFLCFYTEAGCVGKRLSYGHCVCLMTFTMLESSVRYDASGVRLCALLVHDGNVVFSEVCC